MKRVTGLLVGGVLFLALVLPIVKAGAQPAAVTADNLNQMIASAKTPAEHELIAAYYDHEAAENEKLLALHRASINIYSKGNNQLHCRDLIKAYEQAARENKALAAFHREMEKKAAAQTEQ